MKTRDRRRKRAKNVDAVIEIDLVDTSCNVCQAEFLDAEELERHVFQMHMSNFDRERYCKFCKVLLPSVVDFARHIRDEHITDLRSCQYCYRVFVDDAGLRVHERKHQVIPSKCMYSCSQCALLFRNQHELTTHEYQQHEGYVEGVMLNSCFTYLSALLNIKAHTFLQTLRRTSNYYCIKCHLRTPKLKLYIDHLKQDKCQTSVCSWCCNVYLTLHSLCRHFATHPECESEGQQYAVCDVMNVNLPAISCKSCDKVFDNVTQLSLHQAKQHPLVVTLLKCQYCRNDMVGSVALQKHIDRVHKHELHLYKYKCMICKSYIYKHPKDLFAHFFSKHRELQPYTCKICNKKFRVRKKFSLHIKLDHNSKGTVEFDENFNVYFTDANTKGGSASVIVPDHDYGRKIPIYTTRVEVPDEDNMVNELDVCSNDDCKVSLDDNKIEELDISACESNVNEEENVKIEPLKRSNLDSKVNMLDDCTTVESDNNKIDATTTDALCTPGDKLKSNINTDSDGEYQQTVYLEGSDDEPLCNIKKQNILRRRHRTSTGGNRRKAIVKVKNAVKFTCKICKKYCYTFQNYNRHMSFHLSKESKQCIKCGKLFKKTKELEEHVKSAHASSKLTETLQMILRRRKNGTQPKAIDSNLTVSEKIRLTVKKVNFENASTAATVREVSSKEDLSVKKFLESFTPESGTTTTENKQSNSNGVASIRLMDYPVANKSIIQLTKLDFEKVPIPFRKLAMPVKFSKPYYPDVQKAKLTVARGDVNRTAKLNFGSIDGSSIANEDYVCNNEYIADDDFVNNDNYTNVEIDYNLPNKGVNDGFFSDMIASHNQAQDDHNSIPEMAHEVSLEGAEERPRTNLIQRNILLPQLPTGFDQVRIAHLLPQAPYYKIVKMEELLSHSDNETTSLDANSNDSKDTNAKLDLPSGRKLVNVNPLEHLLQGKKVHIPENKYYKSKKRDFQKVIAKAFMNLDKFDEEKKIKKKKNIDKSEIQVET